MSEVMEVSEVESTNDDGRGHPVVNETLIKDETHRTAFETETHCPFDRSAATNYIAIICLSKKSEEFCLLVSTSDRYASMIYSTWRLHSLADMNISVSAMSTAIVVCVSVVVSIC